MADERGRVDPAAMAGTKKGGSMEGFKNAMKGISERPAFKGFDSRAGFVIGVLLFVSIFGGDFTTISTAMIVNMIKFGVIGYVIALVVQAAWAMAWEGDMILAGKRVGIFVLVVGAVAFFGLPMLLRLEKAVAQTANNSMVVNGASNTAGSVVGLFGTSMSNALGTVFNYGNQAMTPTDNAMSGPPTSELLDLLNAEVNGGGSHTAPAAAAPAAAPAAVAVPVYESNPMAAPAAVAAPAEVPLMLRKELLPANNVVIPFQAGVQPNQVLGVPATPLVLLSEKDGE